MENGVVNLACGLGSEFETKIVCLTRRGAFADRLPDSRQVTALGKGEGFSPVTVCKLAWQCARINPHVVHTHNLGPLVYSSLATALGRCWPILHGEHSLLTAEEKAPRRLRLRRRLYRACRAVHTVAPCIRDELLALGCNPPHLQVIANGVDTERFVSGDRRTARSSLGLPVDGVFIGIVGRFGAQKGHAVLLSAFEDLARAHANLHLVMVGGGGPLEAGIREAAAQHRAAARIHFTGLLADPVPAYQALDLLVIPSTNEGMANAALEAMSCSIPVLGNTGCGHDAVIEQGSDGILADLNSPASLAGAVTRLLAEPGLLADMGSRARTKMRASFSIKAMLAAYADLYRTFHRHA